MTQNKPFPSWKTTKTDKGFKATVRKLIPLSEKNEKGLFCDDEVLHVEVFSSRAKAKNWAQKWVRYYNFHGFTA